MAASGQLDALHGRLTRNRNEKFTVWAGECVENTMDTTLAKLL